jgi:hypothetical protein
LRRERAPEVSARGRIGVFVLSGALVEIIAQRVGEMEGDLPAALERDAAD